MPQRGGRITLGRAGRPSYGRNGRPHLLGSVRRHRYGGGGAGDGCGGDVAGGDLEVVGGGADYGHGGVVGAAAVGQGAVRGHDGPWRVGVHLDGAGVVRDDVIVVVDGGHCELERGVDDHARGGGHQELRGHRRVDGDCAGGAGEVGHDGVAGGDLEVVGGGADLGQGHAEGPHPVGQRVVGREDGARGVGPEFHRSGVVGDNVVVDVERFHGHGERCVGDDGGRARDGEVRGDVRQGEELAGGDDLLALAGAAPVELGLHAALILIELHLDGVLLPGGERDSSALGGGRLVIPIVDDKLVVDPEADTVVGHGGERVGVGELGQDRAFPAGGPHRRADAGGGIGLPDEVDRRVDASILGARQVHVAEVGRRQAFFCVLC